VLVVAAIQDGGAQVLANLAVQWLAGVQRGQDVSVHGGSIARLAAKLL